MGYRNFSVKHGNDELIIGYFGADLYWVMLNYHENNKFIITTEHGTLYESLQMIFKSMKMRKSPKLKENVFNWLSEAWQPEESNHMTITNKTGGFVVEFIQNPDDYISIASKCCAICFCLSGSRNADVTNMFSVMVHQLLAED